MRSRRKGKKKLIIVGILLILVLVFGKFIWQAAQLTPMLFDLLFKKEITLKKADNNINILLLGIGGGKHDGPNLSDTVIFVNIDPRNKTVSMVSIPRDLWVPDLNAKINSAYAFGEEKQKGGGLILAKAVVSRIVGQPIDYGFRIDFDGFIKAVDLMGGLDVTVDRVLDDYEYPIEGKEEDTCGHTPEEVDALATASSQLEAFPCRYKHLHFDKGLQHMDGKTALEFVRSRHAVGEEGSDFARSKRQQKIITAFKNKAFSLGTIFNPTKLLGLYSTLQDSIDTDIKQEEFDDFIRLAQQMKDTRIQSLAVDQGDPEEERDGLLTTPVDTSEFRGQWVLIPAAGNGDFSEVHAYLNCKLKNLDCPSPTPSPEVTPTGTQQRTR